MTLIIGEMQIKGTVRYQFTFSGMTSEEPRRQIMTSVAKDVEKSEPSYVTARKVKWCHYFGRQWQFLKRLNSYHMTQQLHS